nr:hypothetical protein [uncultured Bacteroides sp.]
MNKSKIFSLLVALLLLASCDYNDKYFDWLDESTVLTDIKKIDYTLVAADYSTISKNATNMALAKASGDSAALSAIKTNLYLTNAISAEKYVPAFLAVTWPTADNGSSVKVTYEKAVSLPAYVSSLNTATIYKVTNANYESVWGVGSTVRFFTPVVTAAKNVPTILKTALPNAVSGAIVAVDYNKSDSEPTGGTDVYTATTALYSFNGTTWAVYSANTSAYMLTKADFTMMNSNYDNFSATMSPDAYLPAFLKLKYPFAQKGAISAPTYKFYNSTTKVTSIRADEYSYSGTEWVKNDAIETFTDQFVLSNGKWIYNPSIVITLVAVKGQAETAAFYQAITDSVKVLKGAGYVTSYGNNDYYYGGSAFNNNFDFRPSAWKTQTTVYKDMTDANLTALMYQRLPESFIYALHKFYSDAAPVVGVDVTCTINFSIYDGTTTVAYVIVYDVVGKGQFKYVEGSLKKK